MLAPYDSWAHRVAIDAFVRDIPMTRQHPTYRTLAELESRLPVSAVPALLVWGMQDWCFRPECLHRFQQAWPRAQSIEIADAGHYVIEDAPEETLSAIADFLGDEVQEQSAASGAVSGQADESSDVPLIDQANCPEHP